MKICIDARKISDLGIGTYLQNILAKFQKIAPPLRFILLFAPEKIEKFKLVYAPPQFQLEIENALKYSLTELFTISQKIRQFDADLYHSPHYTVPLFKVKPTVATIHDLIHLKFPEYLASKIARVYAKWMIKHAVTTSDHIITVSAWSKKDLIEAFQIPTQKITVVYGAVSDLFQELDASTVKNFMADQLKINAPYLLYCGAFKPHKNLGTLLHAFHQVDRALCPYLVLAGDQLELYPELQNRITQLNLTARIIILGQLPFESLVRLYNGAAAFVFPSEYEGFGLPPLEAMRCGVPVITSNAACLPEVLGDAACYFEPRSSTQLVTQIERLLTDPQLRQTMRARGLEQVKKYSWENSARQILKIYQQFET